MSEGFVEFLGPEGNILLPKNHPICTMSDEEFSRIVDDPLWELYAEVIYATTRRRTTTDFLTATDHAGDSADACGSSETDSGSKA
jgi:hypothetical protein